MMMTVGRIGVMMTVIGVMKTMGAEAVVVGFSVVAVMMITEVVEGTMMVGMMTTTTTMEGAMSKCSDPKSSEC